MLGRMGKWTLVVLAGLLVIGLFGLGAAWAQTPAPTGTPQAACSGSGMGRGGMGWGGGSMLQTWAEALGMTPEALSTALNNGQTVADLAKAKNITIAELVDKAVAARQTVLQKAVDAGRLTKDQMDAMLKQMREEMTENLQNGTCTPGAGGAGCGQNCTVGGQGRGGMGGRWGANSQEQPNRSNSSGTMRRGAMGRTT